MIPFLVFLAEAHLRAVLAPHLCTCFYSLELTPTSPVFWTPTFIKQLKRDLCESRRGWAGSGRLDSGPARAGWEEISETHLS
ncbi:hypothetical protein NDU88_005285 [Pleurodeles waltl]|uniref:Secreted protein n=1 Tax=Pleurodeles waltl TaxID=8319 RepID=A0AAV7TUD5_PLEWA|nr:hypothetical protein NDU88_005285 [Pleurodeles waltl]